MGSIRFGLPQGVPLMNLRFAGSQASGGGETLQGVPIETLRDGELTPFTWRIIPFSKWLITMVNKSPK